MSSSPLGSSRYRDVEMVVADTRAEVRSGLRSALSVSGLHINNIRDGGDAATLYDALDRKSGPDVIICDARFAGEDIAEMFRAVRHNELGRNPFVSLIGVTWDGSSDDVHRMINSGVDYLLKAPFAPAQITDRLDLLIDQRKPFVVTPDYVGPDRRETPDRAQQTSLKLIEVPNSLREKAYGLYRPEVFEQKVDASLLHINDHKIERHAERLAKIAERVAIEFENSPIGAVDPAHISRLRLSNDELKWRAKMAGQTHILNLCDAIGRIIEKLDGPRGADRDKNVRILRQLVFAVRGSTEAGEETASLTRDIAATVVSDRS